MKIVIENHIPFIHGIFDAVADVVYLPSEKITSDVMKDADALITRTRTRCNESLLSGSKCKFIATATIGTDHIDLDYCKNAGITVVSAPGCNAPAVAQYVLTSIYHTVGDFRSHCLGIVGVGHVGSIVARWAEGLGMKVLLNDPVRVENEGANDFVSLNEIADQCDIITFHTPHTLTGKYPTHHIANSTFFRSLARKPLVINSARGPIVDTPALIEALKTGKVSKTIIDCWEGEPKISQELLGIASIATPHIAGYSYEGKVRATIAVVEALASHFNLDAHFAGEKPADAPQTVTLQELLSSYNPQTDTDRLKSNSEKFETLRNEYDFRHEPKV